MRTRNAFLLSHTRAHGVLKVKHLVHPFRTVQIARTRAMAHLRMRRFASHSEAHFRGDPRYDLRNVTNGFLPRVPDSSHDDGDLLQRICRAYARAVEDQRHAPRCYEPTEYWKEMQRSGLAPVMQALQSADIASLQVMYRNFFRAGCAAGLVGVPFGMWKAYFQGPIQEVYLRSFLGDALYRIDHWISQTGGRFALQDLVGPDIGNPFGVLINGTLVRRGSEYQHYCAQQILKLGGGPRFIAEIGGGYGGLAYYLLRDGANVTFIDFDVPESIALTSYYLLKVFPSLRIVLYGERELSEETLATSDVILMPLLAMPNLPARSVHVMFTSHAMSDLSPTSVAEYMDVVVRSTRDHFLYLGTVPVADAISTILRQRYNLPGPSEERASDWNRHIAPDVREVECTYRLADN
jgi:hypothetical protein